MTTEKTHLVVRCPQCGRRGTWLARPHGPFCSERCQLIDMGGWFDERFRISEPLRPDHFREFEELPPEIDPDHPQD
ncbi:MAG: DNA gyrase inhibitor YacG [Opitutaceae bacterium]